MLCGSARVNSRVMSGFSVSCLCPEGRSSQAAMDSVSTGARGSGAQLQRKAAPISGEDCASP